VRQRSTEQPATAGLADDLDRGFSLPASWYTDPAIVELERERIFRRHWQYVGRTAQVAEVGDFFTGLTGATCRSSSCAARMGCERSSTSVGIADTR
jgi:hypothetical protein